MIVEYVYNHSLAGPKGYYGKVLSTSMDGLAISPFYCISDNYTVNDMKHWIPRRLATKSFELKDFPYPELLL